MTNNLSVVINSDAQQVWTMLREPSKVAQWHGWEADDQAAEINEIYFSPLVGANTNLSPTRRSGAELSGQWSVTPTVDLAGSFAYQVARFRTGVYGGVDVSGKDVPLVPK